MSYQIKDYSYLLGINGLSENLLNNHFGLYQGYVKNTNLIMENLSGLNKDSVEYAELRRRFGWEFNGMRLHELFFENITKEPQSIENYPDTFNKIQTDFGSVDSWKEDLRSICMMRGIGWAILYHDRWLDRFINVWIDEHNSGHLAGCRPLIVVDLFEHAYMLDGIRKPDYISNIIEIIDWASADQRLKAIA